MGSTVKSLKLKEKLGYATGELGGSLFWIAISFWLMNFITDELGLAGSLAGTALLIGKFWDALTDPVVGQLSDKTKSRWGRRRPWFLFGALPFGICFFLMFFNPGITGQTQLFIWVALMFILFCTAYTCVNIPYNSLLPELTNNYNERSSLSGYKSAFAIAATLIGAGLAQPIMKLFKTPTLGFMGMGAIFGIVIAISSLIPFFLIKEKRKNITNINQINGFFKKNAHAFKNKPFRTILYSWTANTIGITLITSNLIYYFKYIFNDENLMTSATIIMIVSSLFFIPLTVKISKCIGKNITYAIGMIIFVVSILVLFFIGHIVGVILVYIIMFSAGIGMSAHYVMPWSIVPDTIDYSYVKTGVKQEGVYYGIWTFMIKIGQALSGFLLGILLDAFGYIPEVPQTNLSLFGIRLIAGPIPSVFFIIGIWFLFKYPINKEKHLEIESKIKELDANVELVQHK